MDNLYQMADSFAKIDSTLSKCRALVDYCEQSAKMINDHREAERVWLERWRWWNPRTWFGRPVWDSDWWKR